MITGETTRTCTKCERSKPVGDFHKHRFRSSGLSSICKECHRAIGRANRAARAEHYREYDRERSRAPERAAALAEGKRAWRARNAAKRKAHGAVRRAIRDGRLAKPNVCEVCAASDVGIHGHHADYTKPLNVTWVCPRCHAALHHAEAA